MSLLNKCFKISNPCPACRPYTGDIRTWDSQWPASEPLWTRWTAIGLVFSCKTQILDWLIEPKRAKFFKSSSVLWDKVTIVSTPSPKRRLKIPRSLWGWDLKPFLWKSYFAVRSCDLPTSPPKKKNKKQNPTHTSTTNGNPICSLFFKSWPTSTPVILGCQHPTWAADSKH